MRPLIVLALLSSPAFALDVGQCAAPAEMSARLKAEGQRSIAYGNQQLAGKTVGLIFTAGEGRGYIVQASHPIGTKAEKLCITDRLEGARLYDVRNPATPREALLQVSEQSAAAKCQELTKAGKVAQGSCGFLNAMLARVAPLGERVMMQGQGVTNGQLDGSVITVTANLTGEGSRLGRGSIQYSLKEGATVIGGVFTDTAYTEAGLQAITR